MRGCGADGQTAGGSIVRRMSCACRVTEAQIHKHLIYNTYCFYKATVFTGTRLSITFNGYFVSSYNRGALLRGTS
jgi:hypothetical protein